MRETEYLKSKKRFLPKKFEKTEGTMSLNESLANIEEENPWKKIYPRIKKCDFTNRPKRPELFYIPPHI